MIAMESGFSWLSWISLAATFALGVFIFFQQRNADEAWQTRDNTWKSDQNSAVENIRSAVSDLDRAVQEVAEVVAGLDQERIEADPTEEPEPADGMDQGPTSMPTTSNPPDMSSYVDALRAHGVRLDLDNLKWRKKVRYDGGRGNLGWFVEDESGDKRYFIHRGRGTSVRQAIPRLLLEEWEAVTGRNPSEIELDYQTGVGRGNHAWFVRTFDGQTWRIAAGGYGKTRPTVTLLANS